MNSVVISQPQGLISTANASTTPLGIAGVYTGTGEQNFFPHAMVSCFSNVAGTLFLEFSIDNTNWHPEPLAGYALAAGLHIMPKGLKGPMYFRARYVNGGTGQATFRLKVYYGTFSA